MTRAVYPVHGGMEDWAYAGSWDTTGTPQVQCMPTSNGPYAASRTMYQDATLRCALILVETSDDKIPQPATMGGASAVLQHEGSHDGHVPRNVRVAVVSLDTVEPYVHPLYTNGQRSDELKSLQVVQGELLVSAVHDVRKQGLPAKLPLNVTFDVGGGFTVRRHGMSVLRVESVADADALHAAARGQASAGVRGSTAARQTTSRNPRSAAQSPAAAEWVDFVRGTKTTHDVLGSTRSLRALAGQPSLLSAAATSLLVGSTAVPGDANTRWGKQGRPAPEVESNENLEHTAFHPRFTQGADVDISASSSKAPCTVHVFAALPWATVDPDFSGMYSNSVSPRQTLPKAHVSLTRGNGQYSAQVSVPASDAEDGKAVTWKVRGQYQAVAPPQLVAVIVGDATVPVAQCTLYNRAAEAAATPAAAASKAPVPSSSSAPAAVDASPSAAAVAPSSQATPSKAPAASTPPKDASEKMKEDASGVGIKLVLGVLGGLVVVVAAVVGFAQWRARAQEQRYRQAHAAVSSSAGSAGMSAPSTYSDGSHGRVLAAGPPDAGTLASNGGVAEVVLSPDMGPSAPQGDLTPFDTDHDSDSSDGDLDRLLKAGGAGSADLGALVTDDAADESADAAGQV